MPDALTIKFDTRVMEHALDRMAEQAKEHARPAAQAGAEVLYQEVRMRAPVAKKVRRLKSGRTILPGALKASIYQAYSQDNSGPDHATYHVSWNYRKAPHGHLVEFGTSRAPAHPFLRPSFDAKGAAALQAAHDEWVKRMLVTAPGVTR